MFDYLMPLDRLASYYNFNGGMRFFYLQPFLITGSYCGAWYFGDQVSQAILCRLEETSAVYSLVEVSLPTYYQLAR